jgi:hypothetical protein
VIPHAFWCAPDVALALAEWDLPRVVRLIHRKLGLTQMAIANLTGYSQANISRWLNREGKAEGVTAARLRQFVENTGAPWGLLGLANPSAPDSSVKASGGTFGSSGRSGEAGAEEASEQMKRRTLVAGGSAAVGVGMLAPGVAALLAGDGGLLAEGKLGSAAARRLRQLSHFLITQDYRHGSHALFTCAATQYEVAREQLNTGSFAANVERLLFSAVGELAGCAGWLAYDAGAQRDARYYFGEALVGARLANDRVLAARTYRQMSVQANELGRYREALHLARAARRAAEGWAPPRVRSLLIGTEARALASMGDLTGTLALLGQATTAFEQHNGEKLDPWFNFHDQHELAGIHGICLLNAGNAGHSEQFARAEAYLRIAADHGPAYQRNNALYTARIAFVHLGQANIVDAATTSEHALDMVAEEISSARIGQVLGRVDRGLTSYDNVRAVKSFRDRYSDLKRRSEAGRQG